MAKQFKKKQETFPEPRVNGEIRGDYEVRLLYPIEGEYNSKICSLNEARKLSEELDLDLIEINGKVRPSIIRLDNYSKWLYSAKKKAKENKQKTLEVKEIQLTTNIGKNDLEVKAKRAKEFIELGHKVKVVLTMRGRELTRKDESKKSLFEFINLLMDVAIPENMPKEEGNRSIVILKKKK